MQTPTDSAQMRALFSSVSRTGASFSTTLFADDATCAAWLRSGTVRATSGDGFALALRRERDFERVYHAATDPDSLLRALALLGEPSLGSTAFVADLVGIGTRIAAVRDVYVRVGFVPYRRLVRLQRLSNPALAVPSSAADKRVRLAEPDDAPRIHAFLTSLLDPLAEQIPDLSDVRETVARHHALIHKVGGDLGGVLLFAMQGRVATVRYWFVDPKLKNQGLGSRLMNAFLETCRHCVRIVLWVLHDNVDAIEKYRHFDFQTEGLEDHIVVKTGKGLK